MAKGLVISKSLKLPSKPGKYHRLLCLTGKNKGLSYYLSQRRVVLGRSVNADIQVLDPKSSREHAEIVLVNNKYVVTDLGSQNGIIINDLKVKQHTLKNGDILVIGKTVFRYSYAEVEEKKEDDAEEDYEEFDSEDDEEEDEEEEELTSKTKTKKKKGKKNNRLIIYGVVALLLGYLFIGDDTQKTSSSKPSVKNDLTDVSENFIKPKRKMTKKDKETERKLKMVLHDGLREFRERNYFRAIKEFELALLLSPNNARASFYLNKTKQAMDEEIEKNFMKAKRDTDSLKYRSAIVSYCAIIKLLEGYPDDQRYKDAQDNIENVTEKMGLEKGEISCF